MQFFNDAGEDGFILTDVMNLAPLWCIIHPSHGGVKSNAEVENHFLSVKRSTKTGSRPLLAAFIAERYKSVKSRIARIVMISFVALIHFTNSRSPPDMCNARTTS